MIRIRASTALCLLPTDTQMIDLHPPLSGLPLASVLLLCVAEAVHFIPRIRNASDIVRTTAVVSCIASVALAFVSGYQASSRALNLTPQVEEALQWHHSLGKALLVTALLLGTSYYLSRVATHGRGVFRGIFYFVALLHIAGTVLVGTLGGQLVFTHGVNVAR